MEKTPLQKPSRGEPPEGPAPQGQGSPGPEPDRDTVFYYSRAHRLERASPAVRALNEEGPGKRPSFIGSLTATKPQRILFSTIIIVMMFGLILSMIPGRDNHLKLDGNAVEASALIFEGNTILALKKTFQNDEGVYTGAVDVAVSPVNPAGKEAGSYEVWNGRIFFTLKNGEEFRMAVPFDAPQLLVLLQTETERAVLKVRPK